MAIVTPDIPGTELPGSGATPGPTGASGAIGSFIIGVSPIGGGGPVSQASTLSGPGLPNILPAYLYMQYNDDENLEALIEAFNQIAQSYLNWFNSINLPIYTGDQIVGALLDWVAEGLYGEYRPLLPAGTSQLEGPFGLLGFGDGPAFGDSTIVGPANFYVTNDDVFKRVITWHHFKGDGNVFTIKWLKRRIMRFLTGVNGTSPNIDQTYRISISFGPGNEVTITIVNAISTIVDSAGFGDLGFGTGPGFGMADVATVPLPGFEMAQAFKAAVAAGALELPPQYTWAVNI